MLKYQISLAREEKQSKGIKKSIRILERIFWKNQTQSKYGALYALRSNLIQVKSLTDRLAYQKSLSPKSISAKDDTTSIGL